MVRGISCPHDRWAWVEIDLDALRQNTSALKRMLEPGVQMMCVVKADAYGHGDTEVSRALRSCGVRHFAVSNLEEVLVVTSLTETQEATSEDIEAADAADLEAASGQRVSDSSSATDEQSKDAGGEEGEDSSKNASEGEQADSYDTSNAGGSSSTRSSGTESTVSSYEDGASGNAGSRGTDEQGTNEDSQYVSPHDTTGRAG